MSRRRKYYKVTRFFRQAEYRTSGQQHEYYILSVFFFATNRAAEKPDACNRAKQASLPDLWNHSNSTNQQYQRDCSKAKCVALPLSTSGTRQVRLLLVSPLCKIKKLSQRIPGVVLAFAFDAVSSFVRLCSPGGSYSVLRVMMLSAVKKGLSVQLRQFYYIKSAQLRQKNR